MEQLMILKNLMKEAKYGEFGVKPDLTSSEIQAIEWAIKQIESKM